MPEDLTFGESAIAVSICGECDNAPRREELEIFIEQRGSIGR